MNRLSGKITVIKSNGHLSLVEISIKDDLFKSIIIETQESAPFLKAGIPINIMFKETEVSVAKELSGRISLQNKIDCTIENIERGELLSKVILNYKGSVVVSVITTGAVEQLELSPGDKVKALIKTNEMIITP